MSKLHRTLGVSPFEMLMGFKAKLPLPVDILYMGISPSHHVSHTLDTLLELDDVVVRKLQQAFARNAHYLQQRRQHAQSLAPRLVPGDLVLELEDGAGALQAGVNGPFEVVSIHPNGVVVDLRSTEHKSSNTFSKHVSRLCKYRTKPQGACS